VFAGATVAMSTSSYLVVETAIDLRVDALAGNLKAAGELPYLVLLGTKNGGEIVGHAVCLLDRVLKRRSISHGKFPGMCRRRRDDAVVKRKDPKVEQKRDRIALVT
jgi:hypothetical protein